METESFKICCAKHIKGIWEMAGSDPMNVIRNECKCPVCNHYIGLTQTPLKEANEFLKSFVLDSLKEK